MNFCFHRTVQGSYTLEDLEGIGKESVVFG